MKILWVPHTSFQPGIRPRSDYFIERLAGTHEIHTLCWDVPIRRDVRGLISTLTLSTEVRDGVTFHHMPRIQMPYDGRPPRLTQMTFRWIVRRIVAQHGIDAVVCACNWYALGYPPTDLPVPLIIDYFDLLEDRDEAQYLNHCDAVLCSSTVLYDRAENFSACRYYLPNGIDAGIFQRADGRSVREQHRLNGALVVSLIGLTTSPRLYFLDAVELAAKRMPEIKCLVVGAGERLPAIRERVRARPDLFRMVESVPYHDVPPLFACSDLGLYPGDMAAHFDAALPIKVLEYSAAGKRVLAPPLEELKRLRFSNLFFADPAPEPFAEGICRALEQPAGPPPDLTAFDINRLASRLEEILKDVVASSGARRGRRSADA